jgi:hypothetical protein
MLTSDIPTDEEGIKRYFGGFHDAPGRNPKDSSTLRVFVRIRCNQSLRDLKFNNGFFQWLKDHRLFLRTHGFTTTYNVASAGFISKMSPTLHRRDSVNHVLQRILKQKALDFEAHLVVNRIPVGKGDQKRYTTVVEIQVDRQHLYQAREVMIELFETQQHSLPREIYFVPTPTNGTMDYEVYYQHLRIHHAHVSSLRSFAISNVRDIKTDITIYEPDGVSNPRTMSFEQALLSQYREGTNERLFYSIEPTQSSATEGRYLLVTHKDVIKEAEAVIDAALTALNGHANNRTKVQLDDAPIARTNRIATSSRFQDYANKLKNMIPASIELPSAPPNAWKRRTPTTINLTDETFPPLTPSKKMKQNGQQDHATSATTDTSYTSSDVDLSTFTDELAKIRKENEEMQKTLQAQLQSALQELELRMEQRTQSIVSTMGQTIQQAVEHMNLQTTRSDEKLSTFLQSFQAQADRMTAQMDRMLRDNTSPDGTPVRRIRARRDLNLPHNDIPDTWDMEEDDDDDDKSRIPPSHASRASHPHLGMDATTGGRK